MDYKKIAAQSGGNLANYNKILANSGADLNIKNKNSLPLLLVGTAMRSTYSYDFNLIVGDRFKKENFYQVVTFFGLFLALLVF